jgi:hypothetical protein
MLKVYIDDLVPVQATELRRRIAEQFEGVEYRGEVDVVVVNNFVFDEEEKSQPYFRLRVYLTGDASMDAGDIEQRLEALDIKIDMHDLRKVVRAKT